MNVSQELENQIVVSAGSAVYAVFDIIEKRFAKKDANAFQEIRIGSNGKNAIAIDYLAELAAIETLQNKIGDDRLVVIGEESLSKTTEIDRKSELFYGLLDMIDGTDLMEMQIPHWCSAIVFFEPQTPRIITSVVGHADRQIYSAQSGRAGACVKRDLSEPTASPVSVDGPSNTEDIHDARICFYGQKAKNLRSIAKLDPLIQSFENHKSKSRIFNFAGNAAMVKLADSPKVSKDHESEKIPLGRSFDLVFELAGQKPHDFAPGAFIALKAGAYMCDPEGHEISEHDIAKMLLKPNERKQYVLASNQKLANQFIELLET